MSLAGSLDAFPLSDVLALVEQTGSAGSLTFRSGKDLVRLSLAGGAVTGWTGVDASDPLAVMLRLRNMRTASFEWAAGDAGSPACDRSALALLAEAERACAEIAEMRSIVPSEEHRLVLTDDSAAEAVSLDATAWRIVRAIGDGRTMGEVAFRCGDGLDTYRRIGALVESGLVRVEEPAGAAEVAALPDAEPAPPAAPDASVTPIRTRAAILRMLAGTRQ